MITQITQERKVELAASMGNLVRGGMYPDAAFEKVADGAYVSGKDRKALKKVWKGSPWCKEWVRAHPEEAKSLVW